ncbi:diguanylate cyclase [Ferrovum sp.]|uniref:diguanylate cyclase n=1 Tax=Ferrovum sp. TaxID=2609467 RepID=UPI00262DF306|nr:diguanylate cyclase [Ferrovum sp.]
MHVLLVDDSRAASLPIQRFMEQQGHEVTYVQNGRLAVEAYQARVPDLVLMDVIMPEMDGVEATRRIKAMTGTRWVPVMIMTSLSAKEEIVSTLDAGADDYLIKPVVFEVLEARMRSMQRIATLQDSLFAILDNAFEAIITTDEAGTVQSYNKSAEKIFGYPATHMVGKKVTRLISERGGGVPHQWSGISAVQGVQDERVLGLRVSGEVFPMRVALTEVKRQQGNLVIGMVRDVSEEEAARQRIDFLALHDSLTGLPNRPHFHDIHGRLHGQARTYGLFFLDLDGFKPINDTLHHEAGDQALVIVAGRLREVVGKTGFVARLGGDEFVVLSTAEVTVEDALKLGARLIEAISQPMLLDQQTCRLGASVGAALFPLHGMTPNELLLAADRAMYQAKRSGKGKTYLAEVIRKLA